MAWVYLENDDTLPICVILFVAIYCYSYLMQCLKFRNSSGK